MVIAEHHVGFHGDLMAAHAGSAAINQNHRQAKGLVPRLNRPPEKKRTESALDAPPPALGSFRIRFQRQ